LVQFQFCGRFRLLLIPQVSPPAPRPRMTSAVGGRWGPTRSLVSRRCQPG